MSEPERVDQESKTDGGPLLDIRDLTVQFDTDEGPVLAVNRLSLRLDAGQVLALVGESGCGKTVTALSLLRLAPPNARVTGQVVFAGRDLLTVRQRDLRSVRGRDISMVFQEPMSSLNPVFTVGRQITEVLRRHQKLSGRAARARAVELLDLVRIPTPSRRVDEYPHQMSGGMRQRVMIAMAVACSPRLVIADEPTTALDVTIQAQALDILRDLRERFGTAILLITHNLGVVADLADRVAVMYAGHKVEEAPVDRLFATPQHPYTIGLLGAVPRPELHRGDDRRLAEIPGLVPVLRGAPTGCVFAPRCDRGTDECQATAPALTQVLPDQQVACFHPGAREPQEVPA
ncbi:MAG TPA: ABC transporter ATP-binding protein [Mycobacteriales bacterium]|nr:ABC transporter ATP-binding protein [Mycobacteriales bacterium]